MEHNSPESVQMHCLFCEERNALKHVIPLFVCWKLVWMLCNQNALFSDSPMLTFNC